MNLGLPYSEKILLYSKQIQYPVSIHPPTKAISNDDAKIYYWEEVEFNLRQEKKKIF